MSPLLSFRPDGNPIRQCGSCCHQICQHWAVLGHVQERHTLWIGEYTTSKQCFREGGQHGWWGGGGGRWRESRLKGFTLKIIWTTQTDWPWSPQDELALEESWARKSRKGQSVIINHGWNTWATIPAAPVGLFNCQNRYQGRRHPTSSYKEPAGPLLKVFACHLRRSSFTQRAGLLLFNTSTR